MSIETRLTRGGSVTKIEYKGLEISIASDMSGRDPNQRRELGESYYRTDIRVYNNETDEDLTRKITDIIDKSISTLWSGEDLKNLFLAIDSFLS